MLRVKQSAAIDADRTIGRSEVIWQSRCSASSCSIS